MLETVFPWSIDGIASSATPPKRTATFLASSVVEKGTDPFCRNGPQGAAHKRGLSPFLSSNSRLLGIEGDEVLFRYKDYRDGNQWKTLRLPGVEFIEKFLLHVLPKGMRHIRRFGFMGPSVHSKNLNRIRELLGVHERKAVEGSLPERNESYRGDSDIEEESEKEEHPADQLEPRLCRACGGRFRLIAETPRPTVAQLLQMPPSMEPLADSFEVEYHLPLSAGL